MSQTSRIIPCKVKLSTAHFLPFFKVVITSFSQSQYHHIATLHFLRRTNVKITTICILHFLCLTNLKITTTCILPCAGPLYFSDKVWKVQRDIKCAREICLKILTAVHNLIVSGRLRKVTWVSTKSYAGNGIKLCGGVHKVVWEGT